MRHFNAAAGILMTLALAGCVAKPEPEVRTTVVDRAVPVPCQPVLPEKPELLDKSQILARLDATPVFDDRMKLVMTQLLNYMGWTGVQDAALAACRAPAGDATTRPK